MGEKTDDAGPSRYVKLEIFLSVTNRSLQDSRFSFWVISRFWGYFTDIGRGAWGFEMVDHICASYVSLSGNIFTRLSKMEVSLSTFLLDYV